MKYDDFFVPFSIEDPCGPFLRFDPIYDQIKEARRFEDETLSQGIWQIDRKKADWPLVERLCAETLLKQSKDLQIAGWLCESLGFLHGLEGLMQGLHIIGRLCEIFWETVHPIPESTGDFEYRLRIFEWLSDVIFYHIMMIKMTENLSQINLRPLTYDDWIAACKLDTVSKRSGQDQKSFQQEAEAKGKITLQRFKTALEQTSLFALQKTKNEIEELKSLLLSFKNLLENLCGPQAPSFSSSLDGIKEILRVSDHYIAQKKLNPTTDNKPVDEVPELSTPASKTSSDVEEVSIANREDAYSLLKDLSALLKQVDPHSPTPHLLDLIVGWKDKSLLQVIVDIQEGQGDAHKILRLFQVSKS